MLTQTTLDVIVAFISTQTQWQEPTDIMLRPAISNGSKKASLVRMNKLATLDKTLILGRLGNIEPREIEQVDKKLIEVFDIKVK